MLSGKYSDNTPWGSSYEESFDESGNTLTLVSDPSVGEVSVYTRASIPASVKGGATVHEGPLPAPPARCYSDDPVFL